MRIFLIFIVFCAISGRTFTNSELIRSKTVFKWIDANHIRVKFPHHHQDTLVLKYHNPIPLQENENEIRPCTFLAQLENDPESSGAVIGCMNDENVEIALNSVHSEMEGSRYLLRKNGVVELIRNPHSDVAYCQTKMRPRKEMEDYINFANKPLLPLPPNLKLKMFLNYDYNFMVHTSEEGGPIEYLRKVLTMTQSDYYLPSLTTKVELIIDYDGAKYYPNEEFKASDPGLDYASKFNQSKEYNINAFFTYDVLNDQGVLGIAWHRSVCDPPYYRAIINEKRPTVAESSYVVSHEMGHSLGMSHDFSHKDLECTGIMDYGYPYIPRKWSQCSVNDFTKLYNWYQPFCLEK